MTARELITLFKAKEVGPNTEIEIVCVGGTVKLSGVGFIGYGNQLKLIATYKPFFGTQEEPPDAG